MAALATMRDPHDLLEDVPRPQLRHLPLVDYQDEREIDRAVTGPDIANAAVGWIVATLIVLGFRHLVSFVHSVAPWIPTMTVTKLLAAWGLIVLVSRWSAADRADNDTDTE